MTIDDAIRWALCVHEALRRLGFAASDIYVATQERDADAIAVYVVLKTQKKEWRYVVDNAVASSVRDFEIAWVRSVALHNGSPPGSGGLIGNSGDGGFWDRWLAGTPTPVMVATILAKGIELPCVERGGMN